MTAKMEAIYEQVFSIPLLLKKILKNLEKSDLLKTSLVDKKWNFFSREILRENKNCLAIIKELNSCHNLLRLNGLLLHSHTVPFYGLSISVSWNNDNHKCTRHAEVSKLWMHIWEKLDVKYLSLDFEQHLNCISIKFIRTLIAKKAGSLEELSLKTVPRYDNFNIGFSQFIDLDLRDQWLYNLQILEFPFLLYENFVPKVFIKSLVEAAPKLREIRGCINQECLEFILPLNLARAVKEFYLKPTISSLKNCLAFSLGNPKLNKFRFSTFDIDDHETAFSRWSESDQNDVARIVNQLLENSKESLKKVALDHFDLILMVTSWNIPSLKNVGHLSLRVCRCVGAQEGLGMLTRIDWAKYFPNLKEVSVSTHTFDSDIDVYLRNAVWENNERSRCYTVTTFHLANSTNYEGESRIHMFKRIFPNVKEFYLKDTRKVVYVLKELWTAWEELEAIYIFVDVKPWFVRTAPPCKNCDSFILGLDEKETAYLLENFEEIESLEIVPTYPSIFNLPKLKKLEIRLFHYNWICSRSSSDSPDSYFLTRLVGQCAFARLPGLSVKIHREFCEAKDNCYMKLNHLKDFVKFVECENYSWAPELELF